MLWNKTKKTVKPDAKELMISETELFNDMNYILSLQLEITKIASCLLILDIIATNIDDVKTQASVEETDDIVLLENFLDNVHITNEFQEYISTAKVVIDKFTNSTNFNITAENKVKLDKFLTLLNKYVNYEIDILDYINSIAKEYEIEAIDNNNRYDTSIYNHKLKLFTRLYTIKLDKLNKYKKGYNI